MKRALLGLLLAVSFIGAAFAQQNLLLTNSVASGTISVTNTFQNALTNQNARRGCLLQNQGTHTMYVFFGALASATLATSLQLSAGQTVSCQTAAGSVLTDAIQVTGTAGDAFVVNYQ